MIVLNTIEAGKQIKEAPPEVLYSDQDTLTNYFLKLVSQIGNLDNLTDGNIVVTAINMQPETLGRILEEAKKSQKINLIRPEQLLQIYEEAERRYQILQSIITAPQSKP